ncbi:hypothetical protein HN51_065305 [Arachis hypogaea]|uniref:DUF7794 domain-containing protein n=1 Tax=Arachis hypogaea TaxID=3818 RepID=A0A444ZDU4_ARAHY|nr:uncharacterized protein LOC107638865 [Arachis ipaensis]XP_025646280.1 uncharacterized protein LOC112741482 [Arachis hypogaea]QHO06456.1 uncharacterized protein DS421_14g454780 [Arachis hypogaea]RYR12349.1 hypothetical protein Ahy_B04g069886 isoform B [Arachis hypogaea]
MEFRVSIIWSLFVIFSLFSSQSKGEPSGSVFFIDGSGHQFLRAGSSNDEHPTMLLQEVGAAVSILLGFAPPSSLSTSSSSKLNEVLIPNPFNRPGAVFLLEVDGVNGLEKIVQDNAKLSDSVLRTNFLGSDKVDIHLLDENDVSVFSLDEQYGDLTDAAISDFSSLMGGSYASDALEPLNGVLTIPLANGAFSLHMSKKPEREYVIALLSLIRNVQRAIQMHEYLTQSTQSPAELVMGYFNGIKVLQEQQDTESLAEHGAELFLATVTKIFGSLQEAYKGQIVGVITTTSEEMGKRFDAIYTPHHNVRWLEETQPLNATLPEVLLVRRTLAWVTGIILLISTLIGIHYLLNMPLTRDTLLYSNVKLD